MGVWEFVVVYLAAFVLVQLAVYRYLRGRRSDESQVAIAGPSGPDSIPRDDRERRGYRRVQEGSDDAPGVSDGDPIRRCPNCGATNDPDDSYTFCRSCASRLPG